MEAFLQFQMQGQELLASYLASSTDPKDRQQATDIMKSGQEIIDIMQRQTSKKRVSWASLTLSEKYGFQHWWCPELWKHVQEVNAFSSTLQTCSQVRTILEAVGDEPFEYKGFIVEPRYKFENWWTKVQQICPDAPQQAPKPKK